MKVLGDVRGRLRSTVTPSLDVSGRVPQSSPSPGVEQSASAAPSYPYLALSSNLKLGNSPVDADAEDTTKVTSSVSGPLQLMCKIKNKFMTSWGGGCLPLLHSTCLGDSMTVRSVTDEPCVEMTESLGAHKKRARSFLSTKVGNFAVYLSYSQ
jgi:hypothetical protein